MLRRISFKKYISNDSTPTFINFSDNEETLFHWVNLDRLVRPQNQPRGIRMVETRRHNFFPAIIRMEYDTIAAHLAHKWQGARRDRATALNHSFVPVVVVALSSSFLSSTHIAFNIVRAQCNIVSRRRQREASVAPLKGFLYLPSVHLLSTSAFTCSVRDEFCCGNVIHAFARRVLFSNL